MAVLVTAGMGDAHAWPARAKAADDYGVPQIKLINDHIRQRWLEHNIKPSDVATDGEWCRRVFLDVIGRVPSVDELEKFVTSRESDKKRRLVEELLGGEAYINEYSRNWTTKWTNILIGRSGGTERNSLINRDGMQKYLRDSFAQQAVRPHGLRTRDSHGFDNTGRRRF